MNIFKKLAIILPLATPFSFAHADSTEAADMVNSLLKGEMSAIATYEQALDKIQDEESREQLKEIHQNHKEAAKYLRDKVSAMGMKPAETSGVWGNWAKIYMGGAKLIGEEATLGALKDGEKHGISEYREALAMENMPKETSSHISDTLLANQQSHLESLNMLIAKKEKMEG